MSDDLLNADRLTQVDLIQVERALDAVEGSADAAPILRERVEELLADRTRDLREANEALALEVRERRLMELALRDNESRLRDLALVTADWIWEVDAGGRYTECSDRVRQVLGFAPDEIIGRTPFDLMVEEDAVTLAPVFERLVHDRTGCSELKHRNRHKDGHEVVLLTSCVPMLNHAGELVGFRGADKDVTQRERMEQSLQRRTLELEALLEAGRAIAASIDYDEVLRRVARAAGEALGTDECIVWEYSPLVERAEFRCLWERSPAPGVAASLAGTSYPMRTHAGGLAALRDGVVVQQTRSDPDLHPEDAEDMDRWGEKTWLVVPLVFDRTLLGVMVLVENERERRFDADEVRMAGAIGEQAAVALNNALRHRREEERNRWMRCLAQAGHAVAEAADPDSALGEVARLAAEAVQVPAAFIYEHVRERDLLVTRARHAGPRILRTDTVGAGFPVSETPDDRRALNSGELMVESLSDPELSQEVRALMEEFGEKTLLTVPLSSGDEILGVLVLVENERERVFRNEELDFLAAFGEQVTLALNTARSATTDGLTGLANHRRFYERLSQEIARGRRYGTPVSLLMIDIDDFKDLNDTYGHPAGDAVLRRLGALLAGRLRRDVDLPARYGGEEFAVILPSTALGTVGAGGGAARPDEGVPAPGHPEGAEVLAQRLRAEVSATGFPVGPGHDKVGVTVSVGVAAFPDMAAGMDDLVARADAALYAAKRAGKDRVEVYGRREPTTGPVRPRGRIT